MLRIGQGFDVHRLVADRRLLLGGVDIPHDLGLLGHSDADVLLHAIIDALLGAVGAGDIGHWFPPDDPRWLDADSRELLRQVVASPQLADWQLVNLDATIVAQQPRLAPYLPAMRQNIAALLGNDPGTISIKATTTEQLGFPGRGEGIAAMAVVLLERHGELPSRT